RAPPPPPTRRSSDLPYFTPVRRPGRVTTDHHRPHPGRSLRDLGRPARPDQDIPPSPAGADAVPAFDLDLIDPTAAAVEKAMAERSEEHTSELQSLTN